MTLVGLVGEGITTSLTPPMHRQEGAKLGVVYDYNVIDIAERGESVDDLATILAEVEAGGYDAINVTHPFKQRIISYLDRVTADAGEIGAVNLVLFEDGRSTGYNTDWTGFRYALGEGLGSVAGDRVIQVGAGGAGGATSYALLHSGISELLITDRSPAQTQRLVDRLIAAFPSAHIHATAIEELPETFRGADGVVHATPMGMLHNPGLPFDLDNVPLEAWIAEVVYLPLETALVRAARERGHRVLDGGLMAVGQAVDSIRLITGLQPDPARIRAHFQALAEEAVAS